MHNPSKILIFFLPLQYSQAYILKAHICEVPTGKCASLVPHTQNPEQILMGFQVELGTYK